VIEHSRTLSPCSGEARRGEARRGEERRAGGGPIRSIFQWVLRKKEEVVVSFKQRGSQCESSRAGGTEILPRERRRR
jgi:hypothetical protein